MVQLTCWWSSGELMPCLSWILWWPLPVPGNAVVKPLTGYEDSVSALGLVGKPSYLVLDPAKAILVWVSASSAQFFRAVTWLSSKMHTYALSELTTWYDQHIAHAFHSLNRLHLVNETEMLGHSFLTCADKKKTVVHHRLQIWTELCSFVWNLWTLKSEMLAIAWQ